MYSYLLINFLLFLYIFLTLFVIMYIMQFIIKDLYYSYYVNFNNFTIIKKFTWHNLVEFTGDITGTQYVYKYHMTGLAADSVIFYNHMYTGNTRVLMIRRSSNTQPEQFQNTWALPGGFFDTDSDESVRACALRELKEETGINFQSKEDNSQYEFSHIADKIDRDPRQRTVSAVYKCNLGIFKEDPKELILAPEDTDEVLQAAWVDIETTPKSEFAFDHFDVILQATS